MSNWDWDGVDAKEVIVVQPVLATAVYLNGKGSIVLRQQPMVEGEEDQVIVIPQAYVAAVVKAINEHTEKDVSSAL